MLSEDGLTNRELVSALADGQLRGMEFARVVELSSSSDDTLAAWHAYHVIGDTLRCADLAACAADRAFVARLRGRLASMDHALPAVTPGVEFPARLPHSALADGRPEQPYPVSANDAAGRWKSLAGVASLAAVVAIGWNLAGSYGLSGQQPQLAAAPGALGGGAVPVAQALPGSAASGPQVMLRDARLDELLAAHKQFGGTSALQMPAGFLRNATFENPGR